LVIGKCGVTEGVRHFLSVAQGQGSRLSLRRVPPKRGS
jgi:hypothetical protein